MSNEGRLVKIPASQRAIQERCFHPSGDFVPFGKQELDQSVAARFEKQVARYAEHLAIKTENQTLTYGALNRAANRVAWVILAQLGNRSEPLAFLCEHGAPSLIVLLASLKAGKFYVPLDPSIPEAQLLHRLEDSQVRLIATDNKHTKRCRELIARRTTSQKVRILNIDRLDPQSPTENLNLDISPDDLAYLLYTSGSTGQPKGVLQTQRNALHNSRVHANGYHICAEDRIALFASISFGASTSPIFGSLLNGASIFPYDLASRGLISLADWLNQEQITVYQSVATIFRHFAGSLTGQETFPHLRVIRLGSETILKQDVDLYKEHFSPGCVFIASLAATETNSISWYFFDKQTTITDHVPVGYGPEDKEVLLLGDDGEPVAFGNIGEIAVRSRYLSPGYWQRPDLTAAKFLSDPRHSFERTYLTGDLGRMGVDGGLHHLGRKDFQVKIRGYRIETSSIEARLRDLDAIKEAAVMAHHDGGGQQRLVAYIVPASHPEIESSGVRSALAKTLPDYMIPATFVVLDELPLTSNGKLDRRALPAPRTDRPELSTPYTAPRTPLEAKTGAIWADVLGIEMVGVNDSFLELGGNSLQAMRVADRVMRAYRVSLPLQMIFDLGTVAAMALAITQQQSEQIDQDMLDRLLSELEVGASAEPEDRE